MDIFSNFIKAVAALLWPCLGFTIVLLFKKEIRALFRRLKKGKFFGQELELDSSLTVLNETAKAAAIEVRQIPSTPSNDDAQQTVSASIDEVIKLMAISPKAALVSVSGMIEKEARDLVAAIGLLKGRTHLGLREAIGEVAVKIGLPPHVTASMKLFSEVRNRIVHGHDASDDDVLRAIDSGLTILKALQAVPRETNIVHNPGVDVFSDPELKSVIPGVKGIILETVSPGGAQTSYRIFPSTKNWFKKGQRVSWEWSITNKWGPAWYRVPETNEIESAWASAAEFVGRPLEDI
jgi:hypothetical protein